MALKHAQPLEVIDIQPLGAELRSAVTHSLLKTEHLQLMRLVLPAGRGLPQHQVPGEISIFCIEGDVAVHTPLRTIPMSAGQLVVLSGGEPHAVDAVSDASLLVTVLLKT